MKTGFILAEDEAVKARFSNFYVTDDRNAQRPVKVYFRYPESETEREYPFITIELIDINHAKDRQHSDYVQYIDFTNNSDFDAHPGFFDYWPSESASVVPSDVGNASAHYAIADSFIPVDLVYQVSIYTRSAMHDRQLSSRILQVVNPYRFNSIYVPADGTTRRFDMLDWTNADLLDMESGYRKRIFRKVLTLKMSAEVTHQTLASLDTTQLVSSVDSTIEITNDFLN